MEKYLDALSEHYCNVEILVGTDVSGNRCYGVRIRPYGKGADTSSMVLASGATLEEAVKNGHDKAQAGRFEPLDWSKRPWTVGSSSQGWGVNTRPQFATESATSRSKRRWEASERDTP